MIQENIVKLVQYGLATGLVEAEDKRYVTNKVLELLKMDVIDDDALQQILDFDGSDKSVIDELETVLYNICTYA